MSAPVFSLRSGEQAFAARLYRYGEFLRNIGLSADQVARFIDRAAARLVAKAEEDVGPFIPRRPFDSLRGDSSLN